MKILVDFFVYILRRRKKKEKNLILISMMFVATLSEHLVCNRLFFTLIQPIRIFICGSVLFILCSNTMVNAMYFSICMSDDAIYALENVVSIFILFMYVCLYLKCCSMRYVWLFRCALASLSCYIIVCMCINGMQRVRAYECCMLPIFKCIRNGLALCQCCCVFPHSNKRIWKMRRRQHTKNRFDYIGNRVLCFHKF